MLSTAVLTRGLIVRWFAAIFAVLALANAANADDAVPAGVRAHAERRSGDIAIDGRLDEPQWQTAPRQTGFVERFPKDNSAPTFQTSFAVLYDDKAIYVGIWAHDDHPGLIRALLTRRDVDAPADTVVIGIDSYHDRRTAYSFQLDAAGVQRDLIVFDDTNLDDTWDAVWTGDAAITKDGWTAEFRIPLNQLRFADGDNHEWGFQVVRNIGRLNEQSAWSPWPRSTPQIVSKFGVLEGIGKLVHSQRLELLPYATAGVDLAPTDPLNQHVSGRFGAGLDFKYGLGHAFTLSGTINPDFGQVEADPSLINLTPNQLYFVEKRPFFLEGIDLFKLPSGIGMPVFEGQFYSRRIGAAPPNEPTDYDYVNWPVATTIYGAAKLTGKTRSGWSVGLLDAVTGADRASFIDDDGVRHDPVVAPLSNYAVGRVKRDFNNGETTVGLSGTAVDRAVDGTTEKNSVADQAYTGGVQALHRWGDNAWTADFHAVGSWVHGDEAAIQTLQLANQHLFQRPDASDEHFDPTRTSLSGLDATWQIGRLGDTRHWRFGTGGDLRTPGLELNDIGFQNGSDRVIPYVYGEYREDAPSEHILNWIVNGDVFMVSTFGSLVTDFGSDASINVMLANYWNLSLSGTYDDQRWDTMALRGGDALRMDPNLNLAVGVNTDARKRVWFSFGLKGVRNPTSGLVSGEVDLGATIQARSNVDLYIGPSIAERDDPLQYITEVDDDSGGHHYMFGSIKQTTASMTVRANWTFSPHLALQAYAQPFIASGRYNELKDVDDPHADRYADRFHELVGNEYSETSDTVFVSRPGAPTFSFARPDFDLRQLRSTVVLTWEYRPGSHVYLIWTHGRTSDVGDGRFELGHDLYGLSQADGENLVMIKANYWIGL